MKHIKEFFDIFNHLINNLNTLSNVLKFAKKIVFYNYNCFNQKF